MNTKQRIKAIGYLGMSLLSISLVISGCGPTLTPKQTPTFSATLTTTPTTTPTVTPTPAPENLADANDLHVWIDDYVHAYGGKVTVNGAEKDANQLLGAVKANPSGFIERKTIKGGETLFFVVNGVPLAIQNDETWRAILARDLSDAIDAQFAMPVVGFALDNQNYINILKNANRLFITWGLDAPVVFKDLTTDDWKSILRNWETYKTQLDSGHIPNNIPYNWWWGDKIIKFTQENHMGLRAGSLVWNAGLPDSIYNGGFSKDELLKLLEFTISVRVIKYRGVISEWDAMDELVLSEGSSDKWGFWQRTVGLLDATRLSARLIRKIDPDAKIVITDEFEMEERFCYETEWGVKCLQPDLGIRFLNFVKTLKQEGLVDRVDIENNHWIYDMPSQEYMENYLRQIQALDIELAAPELTVFSTETFPLWPFPRQKYTTVDDPLKAQAEGYRRVVQAYINVGVFDIGLGDVGDETSGADTFLPGSSPALFDMQWKPKMGWYEILKVMYDGFFK
jgi:GH35 family endo-1,4-beta-xylanase